MDLVLQIIGDRGVAGKRSGVEVCTSRGSRRIFGSGYLIVNLSTGFNEGFLG